MYHNSGLISFLEALMGSNMSHSLKAKDLKKINFYFSVRDYIKEYCRKNAKKNDDENFDILNLLDTRKSLR